MKTKQSIKPSLDRAYDAFMNYRITGSSYDVRRYQYRVSDALYRHQSYLRAKWFAAPSA